MEDFTVVPQSLIAYLKTLAERGFTEDISDYDKGMEDGTASTAQAVLNALCISYTPATPFKDKQ